MPTKDDMQVVADLEDTLKAHRNECVGMAANMIGYKKRIIIVSTGFMDMIMINPKIIRKDEEYEAEEGCLSLTSLFVFIHLKKVILPFPRRMSYTTGKIHHFTRRNE